MQMAKIPLSFIASTFFLLANRREIIPCCRRVSRFAPLLTANYASLSANGLSNFFPPPPTILSSFPFSADVVDDVFSEGRTGLAAKEEAEEKEEEEEGPQSRRRFFHARQLLSAAFPNPPQGGGRGRGRGRGGGGGGGENWLKNTHCNFSPAESVLPFFRYQISLTGERGKKGSFPLHLFLSVLRGVFWGWREALAYVFWVGRGKLLSAFRISSRKIFTKEEEENLGRPPPGERARNLLRGVRALED